MFPGDTSGFERPRRISTAPTGAQPELLTTRAAAAYCGYKTPSALRKAYFDGRVMPVGRRGGGGPLMWRRADLDTFLVGAQASRVVDIVVCGPPASGKSMLAHAIARARGTLLLAACPQRAELARARSAELLVVDPFDPRLVSSEFAKLLDERRRLGRQTIMTSLTLPSTWIVAGEEKKNRLLAKIARFVSVIEVS